MKNGTTNGQHGEGAGAGEGGGAVKRLEADASKLMKELAGLTARLKAAGEGVAADPSGAAAGALDGAADQLNAIKERLTALTSDSQQTLTQLDKSVRANPYLYIIGALGLGVLLGKVMRS